MISPNESGVITPRVASFDTETVYSKDYSVADLGPTGYVNDPRFDCYLVSIATSDGLEFVGHPKDVPWEILRDADFLSQNAGFDRAVLRRLIQLGLAPADIWPKTWHCTANMSVYLGLPRSLAGGVAQAFGVKVNKDIRNVDIKGKTWDEFSEELKPRVKQYALDDAKWTLKLWQKYGHLWPELERRVSALTYEMGETGFAVDREGLERDILLLERVKFAAVAKLPWVADGAAILSPRALAIQCRTVGINPPTSLAKDSEECANWEAAYGDLYPWVGAMRDYRRANALTEKLKTARDRAVEGRMPYSFLYFGASTGRWSGAGGFNLQNLSREPMYFTDDLCLSPKKTELSVDIRSKFIAPAGKKLVIADYAQIEARVLPWLARDRVTMQMVREGDERKRAGGDELSIYEIHARASMGWTGGVLKKENVNLYQLSKCRVLGLGFGCGWNKFIVLARKMLDSATFASVFAAPTASQDQSDFIDYIKLTDKKGTYFRGWEKLNEDERRVWVNSWLQVTDFRKKNPLIAGSGRNGEPLGLWKKLDLGIKASAGGTYEIGLPSGRSLQYFNVTLNGGQIKTQTTMGGLFTYAYGGLLSENLTQATAREVLAEAIVRIHDAGIKIVCHVHDEIVCEVDEDFPTKRIVDLMIQSPTWAKTLPLDAVAVDSKVYLK